MSERIDLLNREEFVGNVVKVVNELSGKGKEKKLEVAKKYCEFCKIIT